MKIKTILLAFGLLLVIGMVMFVTKGVSATNEVYEVMIPIDLSDQELTDDYVKMLVMLGVLRLEGAKQLGLVDGPRCYLVLSSCGTNCWYTFCRPDGGSVDCPCSWGVDPATAIK